MALKTQHDKKGFLITFEGGEGAGKSTQMKRLVARLKRAKIPVVLTLQPGGTNIGKRIREVLLNPKLKHLTHRAELLLYMADRAQHVEELVVPALEAGKVVVCDRYTDSSTVYQGMCRGLGVDWTMQLNDFATGRLRPDLVIILDLPVEIGFARVRRRLEDTSYRGKRRVVKLDRLEREKMDFHRKVRKGFLSLARKSPRRYAVLDATRTEDEVARDIDELVLRKLGVST